MKPLRRKISEMKSIRDQEVKLLYKRLMAIEGSQRTAVCEYIAKELSGDVYGNISYSTVIRITKNV